MVRCCWCGGHATHCSKIAYVSVKREEYEGYHCLLIGIVRDVSANGYARP